MINRFRSYINEQHLFPTGEEVLLAISGGVDSTVLCDLMHEAGFRFSMAHCNFHLRPGDCDRDEAFVRQLAERYDVKLYVAEFDTNEVKLIPSEEIELNEEKLEKFQRLLDMFDEIDDVQSVYHNVKLPEEEED